MRITVLAGGIGGARFVRGLLHHLRDRDAASPGGEPSTVTVVGNTGDDIRLFGLQICPDLDTVMYTLGGGISAERGWGREDETFVVKEELAAYGVQPDWFGLGDRDTATHLVRTQMLDAGYPLSAVTAALCSRWQPGVELLPMTDDRVETHVLVDGDEPGTRRAIHFQEWWIRHRAGIPAHGFVLVGADAAAPGPGVVEAITEADVVLLPPSNPVVSVGTILQVPGLRDAVRGTAAPVVGVSPIVGGAPVRGMADACLAAIGVETSAVAVARHYGARVSAVPAGADGGGLLDGWLVHDETDAAAVDALEPLGIATRAVPLLMTDVPTTAAIASAALDLAVGVRR
jgi:LPPG:FO 2-phospho-L-lactate transferase